MRIQNTWRAHTQRKRDGVESWCVVTRNNPEERGGDATVSSPEKSTIGGSSSVVKEERGGSNARSTASCELSGIVKIMPGEDSALLGVVAPRDVAGSGLDSNTLQEKKKVSDLDTSHGVGNLVQSH